MNDNYKKRSILLSFLIILFEIQSPPATQADELKFPINVGIGDKFNFVVDEFFVNDSFIPDGVNTPWGTGAWINHTDEGIAADLTVIDIQGNLPSSNGPYDIVKMETVNHNHDNIYVRDLNTSSYLVFLGYNSYTKPDLEIPNPYLLVYPRWDFYESNFQEIVYNYANSGEGLFNITSSFSSTPTTFSYNLEYWYPQNLEYRPLIKQFAEYEKQTGLLNSVYINVTNLDGVLQYNRTVNGTPVLLYKYSRIIDSSTITNPNPPQSSQESSTSVTSTITSSNSDEGESSSSSISPDQSENSTKDDGSLLLTPVLLLSAVYTYRKHKRSIIIF